MTFKMSSDSRTTWNMRPPESKKSVLKSSSQTQCLSCQLFLHLCSEMAMLSTMREQTRRRAAQAPREPSPLPLRANALAGRPRRQRSRPCWGDPCSDSRGLRAARDGHGLYAQRPPPSPPCPSGGRHRDTAPAGPLAPGTPGKSDPRASSRRVGSSPPLRRTERRQPA
jgi:hypothetical protein